MYFANKTGQPSILHKHSKVFVNYINTCYWKAVSADSLANHGKTPPYLCCLDSSYTFKRWAFSGGQIWTGSLHRFHLVICSLIKLRGGLRFLCLFCASLWDELYNKNHSSLFKVILLESIFMCSVLRPQKLSLVKWKKKKRRLSWLFPGLLGRIIWSVSASCDVTDHTHVGNCGSILFHGTISSRSPIIFWSLKEVT